MPGPVGAWLRRTTVSAHRSVDRRHMRTIQRIMGVALVGLTVALVWSPSSPAQDDGIDQGCVNGCESSLNARLGKGVSSRKQCYQSRIAAGPDAGCWTVSSAAPTAVKVPKEVYERVVREAV